MPAAGGSRGYRSWRGVGSRGSIVGSDGQLLAPGGNSLPFRPKRAIIGSGGSSNPLPWPHPGFLCSFQSWGAATTTQEPNVANPVGRPKKYTTAVIKRLSEELPEMFRDGQSVEEVCAELKMSKQTFYQLRDDNPNFSNAYERGLEMSAAWWHRLGRQGAAAQVDIQPATWVFNMKNRFNWKDRNELSGPGDTSPFADLADAIMKSGNKGS